jgi:hypothetical protein
MKVLVVVDFDTVIGVFDEQHLEDARRLVNTTIMGHVASFEVNDPEGRSECVITEPG